MPTQSGGTNFVLGKSQWFEWLCGLFPVYPLHCLFASCNFTSHGCSDVYRFSIQWPPASTGGHLFFWHIALLNFSPGYIHVCSKGILNLNNYKTNDIQNLKKKKKKKSHIQGCSRKLEESISQWLILLWQLCQQLAGDALGFCRRTMQKVYF